MGSKGLQSNSVYLGRPFFRNVFNILKPLSYEGSFCLKKVKAAIKETDKSG
jgi:hypothetical protein